jgi:hypothetical protein
MSTHGVTLLRISVGIVFLWFGVLKFWPGLSPADELAAKTIKDLSFGVIEPGVSRPVLAVWESLIGIGLLFARGEPKAESERVDGRGEQAPTTAADAAKAAADPHSAWSWRRIWLRITLLLLGVQMMGTFTPLVLYPGETWKVIGLVPTLEGQYIIKNVVLIAAAIVIGATVRGGKIVAEGAGR